MPVKQNSINANSTTPLPVIQGGTGANTAPNALVSLGALPTAGGTMTGNLILNADPTTGLQAATKEYVDSVAQGLDIKGAVFAASTTNITATYLNGIGGVGASLTNAGSLAAFTIDGTTPATNARILIKNQTSTFQNGIYTLTTAGSGAVAWVLTRSTDYNQAPSEINPGDLVPVDSGTVNAVTSWLQTATVNTIGTDPIIFVQFTASPSNFLQVANNLSDVASASTSRTNLGLGTIATQSASSVAITGGTISGTIMQDYTETNTASTQSSAYTINLLSGNVFSLTQTGNVTLSFSNVPASGCSSITLFLIQDGTGSRIPVFPGSVIWNGGPTPTFTTTANHVDIVVMATTDAGTTWRAAAVLNYSS